MTKEKLKKQIKKKFGTISNFCRCAGKDRYKTQIFFARDTKPTEEEFEQMWIAMETTEPKETGNLIDHNKMIKVIEGIEQAGGVYKFSKEHTQFPMDQLYALINRKRKRHTDFVQSLYDHFKIE